MSYCVNCGVELDKTASHCALCGTKVINPKESVNTVSPPPYPTKKGKVEVLNKSDSAILLSVVLGCTAIACGILNIFIFRENLWCLYIIGACLLLWLFCAPALIYSKIPIYVSILIDGIAIAIYVFLIALQLPDRSWYLGLAVPLIILITILVNLFILCRKFISSSILSTGIYLVLLVGFLNVGIELLIRNYLESSLYITWSAIVLTCSVIISGALLTIMTRSRLREEVRRRMHL